MNPLEQEYLYFVEMPSGTSDTKDIPILNEYMHEHPIINILYSPLMKKHPFKKDKDIEDRFLRTQPDYIQHSEGSAVKISDMLTNNQFRRLRLYNEIFRKYDIKYQMVMNISCQPDMLEGITINRDRKDFSERDRLMLNLLGPHIIRAYRNAVAVSAVQRNVQASAQAQAGAIDSLTLREAEVLHWVVQGKSNAEIGIILNIAVDTVKKHIYRVYQKLGVENRTAAAMFAMKTPLHPPPGRMQEILAQYVDKHLWEE